MIAPWLMILLAVSPGDPAPAKPWIRTDLDGKPQAVEVVGIDPANLKKLAEVEWDTAKWSELFLVGIPGKGFTGPTIYKQIPGSYLVAGDVLRFEPKFPIDPDLIHLAEFHPSRLPIPASKDQGVFLGFVSPKAPNAGPGWVAGVDPSGDRVPENLLKIYVHFSRSMSRGDVYKRVSLIDLSGKKLDMPFLEIGEELWTPDGTRITLLLDPGRVKRGLRPREEEGPILENGKKYTLVIDEKWPDASGHPLKAAFRKTYEVGPPIEASLDAKSWKITAPETGTRDPLTITFPRPLDRAMLDRCLVVNGPGDRPAVGRVTIDRDETRWQYHPFDPWRAGSFQIRVDPLLEDLAGNSLARPFEVDIQHPIGESDAKPVVLPFTISLPGGK